MMQWLITRNTSDGTPLDVNTLAKNQLTLTFAAIHTTTMNTTNILYTLATTPEYIGPLREEIQRVLSENDGQLSTRALQQMEKLDSYMKEVNRVYTPGLSKSPCPPHTHLSTTNIPQPLFPAEFSRASRSRTANTSPPAC
jgi:cytochrome P450